MGRFFLLRHPFFFLHLFVCPLCVPQVSHVGLEQTPAETLFQRAQRLVQHILPNLSYDALWDILALRCPKADGVHDFLATEEARELLEDRDLAEDLPADTNDGEKEEKMAYHEEYRRAKPPRPAQRQKQKFPGPRRRTMPTSATITTEEVQSMLPGEARVWRDEWNQRWQLAYKGVRIGSRSFGLYGFTESAKLICKVAWEYHMTHGGDAPTDPVVREFSGFKSPSGRAAATAAKGAASSSSGRR